MHSAAPAGHGPGQPGWADLAEHDRVAFDARLRLVRGDLERALEEVYGDPAVVAAALEVARAAYLRRSPELRLRDHEREIDPGWFGRETSVGYSTYVDRYAGSLRGLLAPGPLEHLAELGVTYLHLMPLLRPRPGDSDGGYAVADYRSVDPRLGTMADLESVARTLHERGLSLCVDLVINHTAREHEWAQRALAGDPAYRDFFYVFPDRSEPEAYERTAHEVFPDTAPGNFTDVEGLGVVWTSFHDFQWDLNYRNPQVFLAMADTMLFLANRGVDVLRLDAVPFLWKRLGTDCLNQPEAHAILQAFRALVRLAAPAVVLKAEAIVAPDVLVGYLGAHEVYRPECQLAYHNQLMVMLWSAVATRDVRLARVSLGRLAPAPPETSWVSFLRSHDDIGWAVTDRDAAEVGWHGWSHRRFLAEFFAGSHPGSYARGELYQDDPRTGDVRTVGGTAALCGISAALQAGDPGLLDLAIRRLLLLYAVVASYDGMPLLWMGDEIALADDKSYVDDAAHRHDSRWSQRPTMDWGAAARRQDPSTVEGRVFAGITRILQARAGLPALAAGGSVTPLPVDDPAVFAYRRWHPRAGAFLGVANVADGPRSVDTRLLEAAGPKPRVVLTGDGGAHTARSLTLPALGWLWAAPS